MSYYDTHVHALSFKHANGTKQKNRNRRGLGWIGRFNIRPYRRTDLPCHGKRLAWLLSPACPSTPRTLKRLGLDINLPVQISGPGTRPGPSPPPPPPPTEDDDDDHHHRQLMAGTSFSDNDRKLCPVAVGHGAVACSDWAVAPLAVSKYEAQSQHTPLFSCLYRPRSWVEGGVSGRTIV